MDNSKEKSTNFSTSQTPKSLISTDFSSMLNPNEKMPDSFKKELSSLQLADMSPNSKKREINKLYCKNNRRKNKEYTKLLEDKIEQLELTIK